MSMIRTGSGPQNRSAFRAHASGLLVPEEHSREREVWTKDEARLLERAMKLLQSRHLDLFMGCDEPTCKKQPMERIRSLDGGLILRCAHRDRVLTRAF